MVSLSDKILIEVTKRPGITDRWLAEAIFGQGAPQQRVNGECRLLATRNQILRRERDDGLIGNFPYQDSYPVDPPVIVGQLVQVQLSKLSEDQVKKSLEVWLADQGWSVKVAWARARGVDIEATRNGERWLIEVKGQGSLNAMRVNYFLSMLGELLQRMDDPAARYSIALPSSNFAISGLGSLPSPSSAQQSPRCLLPKMEKSKRSHENWLLQIHP